MNITEALSDSFLSTLGIVDYSYTEDPVPHGLSNYKSWINSGYNGSLKYLEGDRAVFRESLSNYYPEFQSSLVFLFSYAKSKKILDEFYKSSESNGMKISGYVFNGTGIDYHYEIKSKLEAIASRLTVLDEDLDFKFSLDTQPILERDMAYRSGLGWFGKNSMLISKKEGSYFLIGSLLLNKKLPLIKREIEVDHCGTCTKCVDFCPTDAIDIQSRTIVAEKCISTYTIEHFKDDILPPEGMNKFNGEVFGCEICQEVCPWNSKKLKTIELEDKSLNELFNKSDVIKKISNLFLKTNAEEVMKTLLEMSNNGYKRIFKGSSIERTGRIGMLKNIRFFNQSK